MADWLEFRALSASDSSASFSDLRRLLTRTSGPREFDSPAPRGTSQDELLADATFQELEDRHRSTGSAYPFEIDNSVLRVSNDLDACWAYIFCLLLSLKGANRDEATEAPTRIFEDIAELAACQYVSGRSLKFGFPRRVLPNKFIEALEHVIREIGEGQGARHRPDSKHAKDARLDIIAWRPFPDNRAAQMIIFGQCAAGGNWHSKITDLQPSSFTDLYWQEAPAVHPLKAFFTPFRLKGESWYGIAKLGGILFDRCRIAHLTQGEPPYPRALQWTERALRSLSS